MGLERVRVGLVGVGRIADLQCLGYLEHPRAEIAAVCDLDEGRARERASSWGASRVYTDFDRLLADPEVDAVELLTPHHIVCSGCSRTSCTTRPTRRRRS